VAGDANGRIDVFVRDLQANTTVLASVSGGAQGNGDSTEPSINADGRFVAFTSLADNLRSPGDGNGTSDVFRRDLVNQVTDAVSFTSTGQGGATGNGASDSPHISGDGLVVVFKTFATNFGTVPDTNNVADTYVKTIGTLTPIRVSISTGGAEGNGQSRAQSAISFNGQYVAFVSTASNLVAGDTNGFPDLFIRDRNLNQTIRANISNSGQQANGVFFAQSSVAFNGSAAQPTPSLLAFESLATNLVQPDSNGFSDVFTASISP
jgi:Tol biopolymer transport system component